MKALLPFHAHLPELVALLVTGAAYLRVTTTRRQRWLGVSGFVALLIVTMWPLGDLAASVSLTAATAQRLVIIVLVAPMLLLGMSPATLSRLSRPRPLDAAVQVVTRPGVAIAFVTVVGTLTLTTPVVDWGATSDLARDVVLLMVFAVGIILWLPALAVMPGTKRLSPTARAAYVFVSALVVTSLSFVWIFARHSLYPGLHHQQSLLGMTPLFDQQLAGFVSKLGCYLPMWAVAFTIFSRADDQGIPMEESPLHWADVERELLRVDRRRARGLRSRRST
ncbi:MAG: cytochrome c oxidase assembly protein [Acidobacteria bacterium]|nr:cytochrome c oxidase assembly protein [Acidobacteriota bacterium]